MKLTKLSDIGVSCYKPLHIYNKYIGRDIVVPCRECEACKKAASSRLVSRIETLRSSSAMCLFFTLTYSNEYVPTAYFDVENKRAFVRSYSCLHRSYQTDIVKLDYTHTFSDIDHKLLSNGAPSTIDGKAFPPYTFSVLRKKDLQLFFKRFRKLFNYAFPSQTFKYFAIGEYGVRTFRAHFHGIIFLPNTLSFEKLHRLIGMSWKLGNTDVQAVSSSASSYCASYLNASGVLPNFLANTKAFKPFYCQSCGTVFELFPKEQERFLRERYFSRPYLLPKQITSGWTLRPLSTSLRFRYYPICTGFYQLSYSQQCSRLSAFATAIRQQRCEPDKVTFKRVVLDYDDHETILEFPYSVIFDLRKKFDDKTKKSDFHLRNRDFMDIYNAKRIYDLSKELHVDIDYLVKYIISFYVGGKDILPTAMYSNSDGRNLPSSNFQLALLRTQYSAFELAENDDDLRFLYSYFDGTDVEDSLYRVFTSQLDTDFAKQSTFTSTSDIVKHVVNATCEPAIKHKARNSYYQLLNK